LSTSTLGSSSSIADVFSNGDPDSYYDFRIQGNGPNDYVFGDLVNHSRTVLSLRKGLEYILPPKVFIAEGF